MNDLSQFVEQLTDAIAARPVIPLNVQLWDADACATFFVTTRKQFIERIANLPGFPTPVRIRASDSKRMLPRWTAREVIRWAERQR